MYCRNCGQPIDDNATVCQNCGAYQNKNPNVEDKGVIGWGLLVCCIPVAGLVLFLVWKDTKPRTAKAAGIGALVSVILCILYYLLVFVGALTFGLLS